MAEEKQFENQLKGWLRTKGIYPYGTASADMQHTPIGYYDKRWGGGFSKSGIPDLLIVVKGIAIEIELKASHGRASDLQLHNIKQINDSGGYATILMPKDFEEFKRVMEEVIKCEYHTAKLSAIRNVHTSSNSSTKTD